MAATGKTFQNATPERRAAFISWRWLVAAAVLIIALAIWFVLASGKSRGSDAERGTQALVAAFAKRRLIEPRLYGFKPGEFRPSSNDDSDVDRAELDRAQGLILDAVSSNEKDASLAYARLLLSRQDNVNDALKHLRRVVSASPESSEAHNDLGVALIQQGKLEEALAEFDLALDRNAEMPEALFNRGLCYKHLLLTGPAAADFERIAELEADTGWGSEARQRIEDISRLTGFKKSGDQTIADFYAALANGNIDEAKELAGQNYQLMRKRAYTSASLDYLRASVEGDSHKAERAMFAIELIGARLIETKNDTFIADLARHLRGLSTQNRAAELEAITSYADAVKRFEADNSCDAYVTFEWLLPKFDQLGNEPFRTLTAFSLADSYYHLKRFKESLKIITETLPRIENRDWPYDRSRLMAELALETSRLGKDSTAIKYFEQALSICKSDEFRPRILQGMNVPFFQLGDFDRALSRLRESTRRVLENGLSSGTLQFFGYNYIQIAKIQSLREQHSLALLYAEQALAYSIKGNYTHYAAELASFIALEHARLNEFAQAESSLKEAFDHLAKIKPGKTRVFTEACVLTNAGELATRRGDSRRALGYYDRAEPLVRIDQGNLLQMIDVLRGRADVSALAGRNEQTRRDLMKAVGLIEKNRCNIVTTEHRIEFLASSHRVFDQLISLEMTLGHPEEAFQMSERSRARSLLDTLPAESTPAQKGGTRSLQSDSGHCGPQTANTLSLAQVKATLPANSAVLEFAVTSKRLFLFLVTRDGIKVRESSVTAEEIDRLAHEYVSELKRKAALADVNRKGRELYDQLIKPIEEDLPPGATLYVVPDGGLHFLPFAALVDSRSGKYLIESRPVMYAPSASVLIRCIKESEGKPNRDSERMLGVGNPEFDSEDSGLLPLPDAETEVRDSARFYPSNPLLLDRANATEARVRGALADYEVLHFAVHCVVEEGSPTLAALVLAGATPSRSLLLNSDQGDGGDQQTRSGASIKPGGALIEGMPQMANDPNDGLLFLKELDDIQLPRTKLVVLSACQSALGRYYKGEGIVSLVRPFLKAGVPTIVASLWAIDSQATSGLMIEFHRQRRSGGGLPASEALRLAQIRMAYDGAYRHPFYWAPFIVVGSNN